MQILWSHILSYLMGAIVSCSVNYTLHYFEQGYLEVVLARQGEVDGLSPLAQLVLEETYISSRISITATQLTTRYHCLLLNIQVGPSLISAHQ